MTIKPIVDISHPALSEVFDIDDFHCEYTRTIIADLKDTLRDFQRKSKNLSGVGLAANQIGYPAKIFLVSIPQERASKEGCDPVPESIFINAELEYLDEGLIEYEEACITPFGLKASNVPRYNAVKVKAYDEKGKMFEIERAEGFLARVLQHEYDHTLGLTFLDRANFRLEHLLLYLSDFIAGSHKLTLPDGISQTNNFLSVDHQKLLEFLRNRSKYVYQYNWEPSDTILNESLCLYRQEESRVPICDTPTFEGYFDAAELIISQLRGSCAPQYDWIIYPLTCLYCILIENLLKTAIRCILEDESNDCDMDKSVFKSHDIGKLLKSYLDLSENSDYRVSEENRKLFKGIVNSLINYGIDVYSTRYFYKKDGARYKLHKKQILFRIDKFHHDIKKMVDIIKYTLG